MWSAPLFWLLTLYVELFIITGVTRRGLRGKKGTGDGEKREYHKRDCSECSI